MASNFPPEGYVRLNANVPLELHQKLKVASAMVRKPMGDLIQQLIKEKLDAILREGVR